MKKFSLLLILLNGFYLYCKSQNCDVWGLSHNIPHFSGEVFTIGCDSLEIEGVFWGDKTKSKPLIIFIQGSGPVPLYCSVGDTTFYPLIPYQILSLEKKYNFFMLTKPGIPSITPLKHLDEKYFYKSNDSSSISEYYFERNNLDYYVTAYSLLMEYLSQSVSYTQIILVGHSEGGRIVAELSSNKFVDKAVYMSADPLGRIATIYDQEYSRFIERNDQKLSFYNSLFDVNKRDSVFWGDNYYSWTSFSKPSIIALTQSTIPILIIYGERDENCPNCYIFSFLPSYFNNISVLNYKYFDHNYFDERNKNNWNIVVGDIHEWIESQ